MEEQHSKENGVSSLVEDLGEDSKLGQGFLLIDALEEIDIGDRTIPRLTYVNANLTHEQKG
jgi:hypothetical protein